MVFALKRRVLYHLTDDLVGDISMVQGYCVKCKKKVEMKDAKKITMKNGKPATQGKCPNCGTKVFKIGA